MSGVGHEGVQTGSPKKAFMFAFQNGWIQKEEEALWLQMIEDRNLTPHTYKEDVATEVLRHIVTDYIPCFDKLFAKLRSE